jgi:uncharacterized phage protein (TIGR02220 family)
MGMSAPRLTYLKDLYSQKNDMPIEFNKALTLVLAIGYETGSVIAHLVRTLNISQDELTSFIHILKEESFLSSKELSALRTAYKLLKSKNVKEDNINELIRVIIDDFNKTMGKKLKGDKNTKTRLKVLLEQGFTVENFKRVHRYFLKKWGSDLNMKIYLRPSTLYNGKFNIRVEEANEYYARLDKYENEIKKLINNFLDLAILDSYSKDKQIISIDSIYKDLPLNLQESIVFWLEKGYTLETIITTVRLTADSWSKKPELKPHISLNKILDSKFPSRVSVVQRLIQKSSKQHKSGVEQVNKWLKK